MAVNVFNVQHATYGAVGDGVADDTAAIQSAITACTAANGGIVYLPRGIYKTTSTLTISGAREVRMIGVGKKEGYGSTIKYTGTAGTALRVGGSDAHPNDWGYLRSLMVWCTSFSATTGIHLDRVHRGFLYDVHIFGNSYAAGSRGLLAQNAYVNYMDKCLIQTFETGIDLDGTCNDFTINDTNIGAQVCCVQIVNSDDVRIRGGQHSGTGSTVGHRIIATTGSANSSGFEVSQIHYESNGLDLAVGRVADGSTNAIHNPTILTSNLPGGATFDRCYKPVLISPRIGDGTTARVLTLTSNCIYPVIVNGPHLLTNATFSDSSGTPVFLNDLNGRTTLTGGIQGNLPITAGTLTLDNNQPMKWKDSGGNARRYALLTSGNALQLGDIDNVQVSDLILKAGSTGTIQGNVNGVLKLNVSSSGLAAVTADLVVATAGKGLVVTEGSNARMGASVLTAGAVTVSNTSVTANTRIFLTCQVPGGTPGFLRVSSRVNATSFTITSSDGADTSTVGWLLMEPA